VSLRTRQSPRTRWTLAVAAGSAALLVAAGCGSNGGSGDSGEGTGGAPGGASAYLDCLREQGIDISDTFPSGRPGGLPSMPPSGFPSGRPSAFPSGRPGGGGPGAFRPEGVDDATWQKAQEACESLRPTGGPGGDGPGADGPGGDREGGAAYRNCLSDRGVDLQANPNTTDPEVAEAMQVCAVLRPNATPTP
jgi:hypothetical protein